jgi:hypothetical protein
MMSIAGDPTRPYLENVARVWYPGRKRLSGQNYAPRTHSLEKLDRV